MALRKGVYSRLGIDSPFMAEEHQRPLELNDLLGNLRKEGQLVSSGAFTIDLDHAREKLKQFQLENSSDYVLKLVQAAVAAGATAIRLDSSKPKVVLRMEGVSFTSTELESLFGYLLEEKRDHNTRHLRSLAVAVNSALGIGAREISLESWDGSRGFRHLWTSQGPVQREATLRGKPYCEFVLHRSLGDVAKNLWSTLNNDCLDLLFHRRAAMDKEQAAVHDRCSFSHIPIFINGNRLEHAGFGLPRYPGCPPNPQKTDIMPSWRSMFAGGDYRFGIHQGHHLIERYYPAPPTAGPEPTLYPPPQSFATLSLDYDPREKCYLALGIPAGLPLHLRIFIIEDGVMLKKQTRPNEGLGANVVICGSRFTKDLSEFGINERHMGDALQFIGARLRDLKGHLMEAQERLPRQMVDLIKLNAGEVLEP